MAYDETLASRVRAALGRRSDVAERKMFGGIAFLCDGRMCCGVKGSDLVVRIVETEVERALANPHVRPMDLTGRPLRGFVFVSPPALRTDAALRTWVAKGLRYVHQRHGVAPAAPARQPAAKRHR